MTTLLDVAKVATPLSAVKIAVLTVVAVVVVGLAGTSWYLFRELNSAVEKNGQLKEVNATLKQDLELVRVGQAAMGLGQLLSDQQKQDLDKKARDTRTGLKQKEQQIDRSTATPEEKARQKSEARMASVWTMYCHIQPQNAVCQPAGELK